MTTLNTRLSAAPHRAGRVLAAAPALAALGLLAVAPLAAIAQQAPAPAAGQPASVPAVGGGGIQREKTVTPIAQGKWTGKRLPDGQPDVQGFWSNTIANHNNFT